MAERLSDADLHDNLCVMRDRIYALECAISGASITSPSDRAGLIQFVGDIAGACKRLGDLWHAEHVLRGGNHG